MAESVTVIVPELADAAAGQNRTTSWSMVESVTVSVPELEMPPPLPAADGEAGDLGIDVGIHRENAKIGRVRRAAPGDRQVDAPGPSMSSPRRGRARRWPADRTRDAEVDRCCPGLTSAR